MKILIENLQDKVEVNDKIKELINTAVNLSLQSENVTIDSEVSIYFVDNEEIRRINKEQRGIDKETDVLTFPMARFCNGKLNFETGDIDMESGLLVLGDIVVSLEKAEAQRISYGHSIEREILFLITHGMYHILGYDHLDKQTEKEMISKQEIVLDKLNLKRGIERGKYYDEK